MPFLWNGTPLKYPMSIVKQKLSEECEDVIAAVAFAEKAEWHNVNLFAEEASRMLMAEKRHEHISFSVEHSS